MPSKQAARERTKSPLLHSYGRIVNGSSNSRDDFEPRGIIRRRVCYEHGDRNLPSIRQGDQSDVIGRGANPVIHIGSPALVRDLGSIWKVATETA